MTRKNPGSGKPEEKEEKIVIPQAAVYPGIALAVIGFIAFYLSGRANPGIFTWQSYASLAVLIVGGLLWLTSGMDKPHLIEWGRSALLALSLALVIRWAIAEPYRIPSGSMETTLHGDPGFGKGDRVFVNKFVYGLRYPFMNKRIWKGRDPERWDLVVFKTVEEDAIHKTLVKRIVGMPGEHIQIREGRIYADGTPLTLPPEMPQDLYYTSPLNAPYGVQEPEAFSQIPPGHYLVLGDNSAHSRDGRYFGWLPNEHIVGRVSCIWWPPFRWRDFTGFSHTTVWQVFIILLALCCVFRLTAGRLCSVQTSDTPPGVDHLLVSFLHYGPRVPFLKSTPFLWRKPGRGDLVLYSATDKENKTKSLLVGRVAALAGEQVAFANGTLLVNDTPVSLPKPAPEQYPAAPREAPYGRNKTKEHSLVPPGHCFILSDTTSEEEIPQDSRSLGWVPEHNLVGRAVFCWWPLKRAGHR